MPSRLNTSSQRLTLSAMLLAVMLVLGWVESLLPSPGVPGIKLGLSNSVLIFAVYMLDVPTAYILMTSKVMLSALMFGGVSAMIYAFAGGLTSLTMMVLLHRLRRLDCIVISMAGGMSHNIGQVMMAILVLHTPRAILGYLSLLMLVGLACGALTGVAARQVMHHLKHLQRTLRRPRGRRTGTLTVILALVFVLVTAFAAVRSMQVIDQVHIEVLPEMSQPIQSDTPPFTNQGGS